MDFIYLFDLFFVGLLIISLTFWIFFAIITMRKIDKAVVAAGKPRPCQWDPICGRAILYTWPIVFSGESFSDIENQIVDTQIVKKNINLLDKVLAWVLFVSGWTMIICIIIDLIFDLH